jgi:hypothetical protein
MNVSINTFNGSTKVVSLSKFLQTLEIKTIPNEKDEYRFMFHTGGFYAGLHSTHIPATVTTALLMPYLLLRIAKRCLLEQADLKTVSYQTPLYLISDAIYEHAMEMGASKYAVRVSRRNWIIADPEDFQIIKNDHSCTLICLRPTRAKLIYVDKETALL